MQITSFDYVHDKADHSNSFARLATLIGAAREEAEQAGALCLLFDNGDTLQGGPMAEFLVNAAGINLANPMVSAMNLLCYDAAGLGNHDCDFGLSYLNSCIVDHDVPVICSNLRSDALKTVADQLLIERQVQTGDGTDAKLRIGVLSSLPDKTATWNRHHFSGRAVLSRPLPVLTQKAADLRAQGADLVVVLAHMGLSTFDEGPDAQNLIADVAQIEGVDVVIGGHTHLRFPGPDHAGVVGADVKTGLVYGTPVVQPGPSGSDLGVVDLCLEQTKGTSLWRITGTDVQLRSVPLQTREDPRIVEIARAAHQATRDYLKKPAGRIAKPMHSYFSLADISPVTSLMAFAKEHAIARAVADTDLSDLPLLSVASAKLSGGFDGPDNFISLNAGDLQLRHIAGLNPYANQVWAVRTSGARLLDWLERSAVIFNTLQPDNPDQLLIDPQVPGFHYDSIYGLTYEIDPREPPKFDRAGRVNAASGGRIKNVFWNGKPIDAAQEFLVATTDHRAGGGGLFRPFPLEEIVIQGTVPLRQALIDYLASADCKAVRSARPWKFAPDLNRQAVLLTSPDSAGHFDDVAHLSPEACGQTADGFLKVRLSL